jgi:hypothetical protein
MNVGLGERAKGGLLSTRSVLRNGNVTKSKKTLRLETRSLKQCLPGESLYKLNATLPALISVLLEVTLETRHSGTKNDP